MFGLMGSHRTGKTTTGREAAARLGIPFVQTRTSDVVAKLGYDSRQELPFRERLVLQNAIMNALDDQYHECVRETKNRVFIADRTPLDVLTYTFCEVSRQTLADPELAAQFEDHWQRAYRLTRRWFSLIMYVWPAIEIKDDPTKAPPCPWYISHWAALGWSILCQDTARPAVRSSGFSAFPNEMVDLEQRVSFLIDHINVDLENDKLLAVAHKMSAGNLHYIKTSNQVGCFDCCRIFAASEVKEFIRECAGELKGGETAMCPHCKTDAMLGDAMPLPVQITSDFLNSMNSRYFNR